MLFYLPFLVSFTAVAIIVYQPNYFAPIGTLNSLLAGSMVVVCIFAVFFVILYLVRKRISVPYELLAGFVKGKTGRMDYFRWVAANGSKWKNLNETYHDEIIRLLKFLVPSDASVAELGTGDAAVLKEIGGADKAGFDFCKEFFPQTHDSDIVYYQADVETDNLRALCPEKTFDYVIASDLFGYVSNVQNVLANTRAIIHGNSRIVITAHNYVWEPVLKMLEALLLKMPQPKVNWLSSQDIMNFLDIEGFDVVKKGTSCLLPAGMPVIGWFANRILVHLPLFRHFGVIQYFVARPRPVISNQEFSVSVVVPARNESGNIRDAILRTPKMGKWTEIIFVEGHSTDDTWESICKAEKEFSTTHRIKILRQDGKGKGDAVRKGFEVATGDIVTILDADLTMPPEELPQYYGVLSRGYADFVNGSRLVYSLEQGAMRFFNILGNKFFSVAFTWLLGQPLKDTLCGTKMLFRRDYERIVRNRNYFGNFDPFGDFDLLFGAAKLNLKIVDLPIHYKARTYGDTNIQRWKHGVILLRMVLFALKKIKFI